MTERATPETDAAEYDTGLLDDLTFPDKDMVVEAAFARKLERQRDELVEVCRFAKAHIEELRDAWQRGVLSEHDGQGGLRSNRNVDVDVMLREALSRIRHSEG